MITQIQVTGIAYEIDENTHKYVTRKVGRLDRYLPKHARKTVSAEVILEQVNHAHGNKYQAEIKLNVPNKAITAKDTTGNMFAAIDIIERKIMAQLREYKQSVVPHIGSRRILNRIKRGLRRK